MAEEGGDETAEYKAFRACTPQLVSSIKGHLSITDKLLAEGLISEDTYDDTVLAHSLTDRTKAKKIVTRVRTKIQESSQNYYVFCDILEEEGHYYKDVLEKLQEKRTTIDAENRKKNEQLLWCSNWPMCFISIVLILLASLLYLHQPQCKLVTVLQGHYQQITEIDYDQYLPQNMEGYRIPFIIPNIIPRDRLQTNTSTMGVTVTNLLYEVKTGTKLAITGRPGVGKSTLARHIVKLWAQGKALSHFSVLFHICLGRVSTNITGLQSLIEEECHGLVTNDPELDVNELVKRIKDTKGDEVVFVLDALDEYYPSQHVKNDYIIKLIKNISLPQSAIIVTSRSRRIDDFKTYFTQSVEVGGFNDTDIDIALYQLGKPLGPRIAQFFEQNPNVKKMCYLPLHMTMLIYLASLKVESLSLVDTETKIYSSFLHLTVENYYTRRHEWKSLSVCFEHQNFSNDLCDLFDKVCELAFNATVDHQQTFTSREIEKLLLSSDKLEALSLFKIEKENRPLGSIDVYYFSHQTFQEFMAACHLLSLPEYEQKQIIHRRVEKQDYVFSDLIWKFFFGLVGGYRNEKTLFNLFINFVSSGGYKQLDSYYVIDLYPLMYAYETGKRNESFASLLSKSNITGPGNNYSLHIQINKTVDLRFMLSFGERSDFIFLTYALRWIPIINIRLELQVSTTRPDPRLCAEEYRVIANSKHFSEYCSHKVEVSNAVIIELEYFTKQYNLDPQLLISTVKSTILKDQVQASNLQLELVDHIINSTQLKPSLVINNTNLTHETQNFTEEELKYIRLGFPLQQYMKAFHSSSLKMISLVELKKLKLQNTLTSYDLTAIAEGLKRATSLETLDLSNNFLSSLHGLLVMFPSLKQLKNLDLSGNFISADNMKEFATGFKYLSHLNKLNLSGNLLFYSDETSALESFGENLIHLQQLRELDLSHTHCQCSEKLASGLNHLTELKKLGMSNCMLENNHLKHFKQLSNLEELDLSLNLIESVSSGDFIQLWVLRELNLSSNYINQPLSEIYLVIYNMMSLRKLDLSNNFICADEESLRLFLRQFATLSQINEINLSSNMLFVGYSQMRRKFLRVRFGAQSHTKEIRLERSQNITDKVDQMYAACVCEYAGYRVRFVPLKACIQLVMVSNNFTYDQYRTRFKGIKEYVQRVFSSKEIAHMKQTIHYQVNHSGKLDKL